MTTAKSPINEDTTILTFLFTKEEMKKLVSEKYDYVLVHVGTSNIISNAKKYAALTVNATAYNNMKMTAMKVSGCPVPPCSPQTTSV